MDGVIRIRDDLLMATRTYRKFLADLLHLLLLGAGIRVGPCFVLPC
jgi:hypothetical protein